MEEKEKKVRSGSTLLDDLKACEITVPFYLSSPRHGHHSFPSPRRHLPSPPSIPLVPEV